MLNITVDGCCSNGTFVASCVPHRFVRHLITIAVTNIAIVIIIVIVSYTDSEDGTTFEGCGVEDSTAYYYPDEDTTQYLYETFPEVRRSTIASRRSIPTGHSGCSLPNVDTCMRTQVLEK